ncbi:MAG: YggN family protein [candidate division Zixibacteria bacterium]|nr:YggN family protein [candidate division Zixibacteria bacterium]
MKKLILTLVILVFTTSTAFAIEDCQVASNIGSYLGWYDGADLDIVDGTIIMKFRDGNHSEIEITEKYELYIDGEIVEISRDQEKIVKKYYVTLHEVLEGATLIGIEGAEIGIAGANIGIKAVTNIWKFLLPGYDTEDFEEALEEEAEALEEQAEKLEVKAEKLEQKAEDAGEAFEEMVENIPELQSVCSSRGY